MIEPHVLVELLRLLSRGDRLDLQRLTSAQGALLDALSGTSIDADSRRMLMDHGVCFDDRGATSTVQIPGGLDVLDAQQIRPALQRGAALSNLEVRWSVDSTNSILLARAATQSIDGTVLLAEHQSAGRGRRGRTWLSPVASNLYMSIGAHFPRLEDTRAMSLATGVAIADALSELGYADIGIKWPNDLQIGGRKLSGILIESSGMGPRGVAMVIGIGINVRVPAYVGEQIDQPWIDLTQAAPIAPNRNRICAAVVAHVFDMLDSLRHGQLQHWLERFKRYDIARDQPVTIRFAEREVHGIARGIDHTGELKVDVDGLARVFSAGEVSLRVQ